jgi:chromosome segregation ATPase
MRGINLVMPTGCGLLRDLRPYPERYETNFALCTEKKGQWLGQSLGQLEQQFENVKAELHRIEGRLEILRKVTPLPADDIKKFEEQMMQGNMQLGQLAANVNQLKGEKSATEYYRRQYVFAPNDP